MSLILEVWWYIIYKGINALQIKKRWGTRTCHSSLCIYWVYHLLQIHSLQNVLKCFKSKFCWSIGEAEGTLGCGATCLQFSDTKIRLSVSVNTAGSSFVIALVMLMHIIIWVARWRKNFPRKYRPQNRDHFYLSLKVLTDLCINDTIYSSTIWNTYDKILNKIFKFLCSFKWYNLIFTWYLWNATHTLKVSMTTSSNGNIFCITGPLCGEFTSPGEFPTQKPVTRSFDVFFDLRLNKRLSKQPWGWWFEMPSWSLWRQCNGFTDFI